VDIIERDDRLEFCVERGVELAERGVGSGSLKERRKMKDTEAAVAPGKIVEKDDQRLVLAHSRL